MAELDSCATALDLLRATVVWATVIQLSQCLVECWVRRVAAESCVTGDATHKDRGADAA